jgi:succinate dehydrogenase/fumarate reductase flavoprotein subunit
MVTSLLTENGEQGARVIGATGFNNRTGEFMIFKSKASVLAAAGDFYMWMLTQSMPAASISFQKCNRRWPCHGLEGRRRASLDGKNRASHAGHRIQAKLVWRRRRRKL